MSAAKEIARVRAVLASERNAKSKRRKLSFTISPQVSDLIDRLLASGLYGRNRTQVARELLYQALRAEERKP